MFGPTASGYAQPYYPEKKRLSLAELFALFGVPMKEAHFLGSADSEEYLAVVSYLVARSQRRMNP